MIYRRRLTACMSLYFPNPSQPSLTVPFEAFLHTLINAKEVVPTSSQQCCDSAPSQEELLPMYRGLGCSQQCLFFPLVWVKHCHSLRPMVLLHWQASLLGLYQEYTFKRILFWASLGFFPLVILSSDVVTKLWSLVFAYLQPWTENTPRQFGASNIS